MPSANRYAVFADTAVPAPASATAAEDASQPPMQTDEVAAAEAPRTKTEEETQWEAVQQNPADFTAWTALIGLAEKEVGSLPLPPGVLRHPAWRRITGRSSAFFRRDRSTGKPACCSGQADG